MTGKRRAVGILTIAGAVILLLSLLLPRSEREPSYQGRTISAWLGAYTDNRYVDTPLAQGATNAVHHIGTNALPWLVKWINYEPPKWKVWINENIGGESLYKFLAGSRAARQRAALAGFEILGPEADPAVTALTNLLGDWRAHSRARGVLYALMYIGETSLPALLATVTNTTVPTPYRCDAAERIGAPVMNLGTNADWVVPILLKCLKDTDVGAEVAGTLGGLARKPEIVVPALREYLRKGDYLMQVKAAEALGCFGKEATAAVPELLAVTGKHDALATEATNALMKIAPQALK